MGGVPRTIGNAIHDRAGKKPRRRTVPGHGALGQRIGPPGRRAFDARETTRPAQERDIAAAHGCSRHQKPHGRTLITGRVGWESRIGGRRIVPGTDFFDRGARCTIYRSRSSWDYLLFVWTRQPFDRGRNSRCDQSALPARGRFQRGQGTRRNSQGSIVAAAARSRPPSCLRYPCSYMIYSGGRFRCLAAGGTPAWRSTAGWARRAGRGRDRAGRQVRAAWAEIDRPRGDPGFLRERRLPGSFPAIEGARRGWAVGPSL